MAKRKAGHSTCGSKKRRATRAPKTPHSPSCGAQTGGNQDGKKKGHSISQLPTELTTQILGYISFDDSLNFRLVSERFARASERFVFRSIRLYLPRGTDIPTVEQSIYFSTRIFSSGAREVRIHGDANGAAHREGNLPEGNLPDLYFLHESDKRVSAVGTGLLRNTTSVFTSLRKISTDFKKNILPAQQGYGAFALKFLEALDADARKSHITAVALHNLPLWILQKLSAEKPKVLKGSLRHVKDLSLGITPHLEIDVDDRLNAYRDYHSFDRVARTQLSAAYAAFRTFLASAPDVEELELDSVYLNMSCQFVDWGAGVLTAWRSAYRTGTVPFRLLNFTARSLGYTSRWPDYPRASFECQAALIRG